MAMAVKGAHPGALGCPAGSDGVGGILMHVPVVVEDCDIVASAPACFRLLCSHRTLRNCKLTCIWDQL